MCVYRTESGHVLCWDIRQAGQPLASEQLSSDPVFALAIAWPAERRRSAKRGANMASAPGAEGAGAQASPSCDESTAQEGRATPQPDAVATISDSCARQGASCSGEGLACSDGEGQGSGRLIAGGGGGELFWLHLHPATGALHKQEIVPLPDPGTGDVCVRADSRIVAVGGWVGGTRLYDVRRRTLLAILKHHKRAVAACTFTPEDVLATGARDGVIALWDAFR